MEVKPKILVVDDKPENLFAIETVLKNMDVDLVKVTSGNDALKATLHHDFVLALLDIQMPGMDGYELASILREEEKTANLPFIFISAVYTDAGNIFKGYELGAFSFITKPFQPEILQNKVRFFVDHFRHEAELEKANLNLELKNQQLTEAYEELDFFTFSVSHDLRAPLRFILGYAKMLEEDFGNKLNKEGQEYLKNIKVSANAMEGQIDALLAFSNLSTQDIRKSEIDMNWLVKYVVKEKLKDYPDTEIEIKELPPAFADNAMIKLVVENLVSNALKFSRKVSQPAITISAEEKKDENVYRIKDNGVGFNMAYAGKLFGVFQRLHSAEEFEGAGVGLAYVKKIINRHGGKVWAESEEKKGASFFFTLPKNGTMENRKNETVK